MKKLFIDIGKCDGCRECELACAIAHSTSKRKRKTVPKGPISNTRIFIYAVRPKLETQDTYHPFFCQHCEEAPCIEACISGAMQRDEKTGLVTNDPDQCVGCWSCVMVCPFGVIGPQKERQIILKCDGCQDLPEPACLKVCTAGALFFSSPDKFLQKKRKQLIQRHTLVHR